MSTTEERLAPLELDPNASYDALRRKQPARLNWISFARAIPGLAQRYTHAVPAEFVHIERRRPATVSCVCGVQLEVPDLATRRCDCGRDFAKLGDQVLVAPAVEGQEEDADGDR